MLATVSVFGCGPGIKVATSLAACYDATVFAMDPNADRIVWTEGPDRPDSVNTLWRPVAALKASLAESLRRPPRRGRRSAVNAICTSAFAVTIVLLPAVGETFFPLWLGVSSAVAALFSSGAEVLPEFYESAAPPMRAIGHTLGILSLAGIFVAGMIAAG